MAEPTEKPGIPLTDIFGQLEKSAAQREQPSLVRDMVLNALGDETRQQLETKVDGGLQAALERGRLIYQWISISNRFQLGFETNPDATECGRRLAISISDPEVNEKLVAIIKREFPTAYEAIIEKARQEQAGKLPAEIGQAKLQIETLFGLPIAEIDEKVLAQKRFKLLISTVGQSPTGKIRLSLREKWQDKEAETTVSYQMEKVVDPRNKDKSAILVTEEVPITVYEEYEPDVPHQRQYFNSKQEPRTIKYYLHDEGETTYDEETLKAAATGLKYRYAGFGVDEGTPDQHIDDIKNIVRLGWSVWMSLPGREEIENPTLQDLLGAHSIEEVVKREFVVEQIE